MGEPKHGDGPVTRPHMVGLLRKVCAVLNAHEIDYFLTCGTLLGYIRDHDFVKWDTDIDMGIFDIYEVLKLEKQFRKLGLGCELHDSGHCPPKITIKDNELDVDSRLRVDLFEFEETRDGIVFKFGVNPWYVEPIRMVLHSVLRIVQRRKHHTAHGVVELLEASSMPSSWTQSIRRLREWKDKKLLRKGMHIFEPFTCVKELWFGISVSIPSRPIDHLRLLYGDEWYIPKPNYSQSLERQRNIRRVKL